MKPDPRDPAMPRPAVRIATFALALVCAGSPLLARAADQGEHAWVAWAVLVAVALLVAGILIRAAMGSSTPPGWLAFLARRREEGRPTSWREWPDD
jgi:hypothetical protein